MTGPGRRRAVRFARILQTWPLLYGAAGIVGLLICGAAWIGGRPGWLRFGLFLTVPLLGLFAWLGLVLSTSAVLNLGVRVGRLFRRGGGDREPGGEIPAGRDDVSP